MANEASVRCGLSIRKTDGTLILLNYNKSVAFNADVTGTKGPSPGAITVTTAGVDVDFSQLVTPGLCYIKNMDADNYIQYGIRDPATHVFYPVGEILPGEDYVIRLSRNLGEEYFPPSGTGTSGPISKLHLKANVASVVASVEAFEA